MRFEARELKSYAEPIAVSEIKLGAVYFSLMFMGENMLDPILEPLVFIGTNLEGEENETFYYFQDLDSYRRGIRHEPDKEYEDAEFHCASEANLKHIFEYERALDGLLRCALRRQKILSDPSHPLAQ